MRQVVRSSLIIANYIALQDVREERHLSASLPHDEEPSGSFGMGSQVDRSDEYYLNYFAPYKLPEYPNYSVNLYC